MLLLHLETLSLLIFNHDILYQKSAKSSLDPWEHRQYLKTPYGRIPALIPLAKTTSSDAECSFDRKGAAVVPPVKEKAKRVITS